MLLFVGAIIVLGSVLGGFMIHGGQVLVLNQPTEFIIIGGAALGSVVISTPIRVLKALVGRWSDLPLAGLMLTCIDRDGTLSGPDLQTLAGVRRMTRHQLQYSGGVASVDDIRHVGASGAEAVIVGKALYEGKITLEQALSA